MSSFRIYKEYIADYSFLAFIAVLPFLDILAPITAGATAILALVFTPQKDFLKIVKNNKSTWFLLLYFLLAVLTLIYSEDLKATGDKIGKLVAFVLIPLMFLLVNPTRKLLNRAKRVFVFAMIVFCVFSLLKLGYNYIVNYEISHWYNFVQDSMYHKYMPEDAMYINTAFVLLLFGNFKNNIKLIGSILFLIILFLFSVRLGLFIYVLIATIYFIINIKSLLNWKTFGIAGITLIVAFLLIGQSRYASDKFYDTLEKVGFNTGDRVSEIGAEYHKIGLREQLWSSSIELIKQKPVFGYGAGVEKKPLAALNQEKGYDIPSNYHSHNQFLSLLVQFGVFGIIWLLIVFSFLFRETIKTKSITNILVVVVMLVSMITESYLDLQQGVFYFCVFTSLLVWNSNVVNFKQLIA